MTAIGAARAHRAARPVSGRSVSAHGKARIAQRGDERMEFISWLKQPFTTFAVVLFIVCSFYHACLGVDEIVEDYVSAKSLRVLSLGLNRMFFFGLGAAALYATLAISFGKF